jgi:hypothetical protein
VIFLFLSVKALWSNYSTLLIASALGQQFRAREALKYGLAIAVFLIIVVLSLASGKRHSYLLPLFPLLAIAVAVLVPTSTLSQRFFELASRSFRYLYRSVFLLSFLAALLIELLPTIRPWLENEVLNIVEPAVLGQKFALFLPLIFIYSLGLVTLVAPKFKLTMQLKYLCVIGLMAWFIGTGLNLKYTLKGFEQLAAKVHSVIPPDTKLPVFRRGFDESFDVLLALVNARTRFQDAGLLCKGSNAPYTLTSLEELARCFQMPATDLWEMVAIKEGKPLDCNMLNSFSWCADTNFQGDYYFWGLQQPLDQIRGKLERAQILIRRENIINVATDH